MVSDEKDKQIAELQQRVEQLARGQSFWTSTISNALGSALGNVMSAVMIALALALWNNPELFGWFTVPRLVSAVVGVIGILLMAAFMYIAVKAIKLGWGEWDRRMRFLMLFLVISEVGYSVLLGLAYYSFVWRD